MDKLIITHELVDYSLSTSRVRELAHHIRWRVSIISAVSLSIAVVISLALSLGDFGFSLLAFSAGGLERVTFGLSGLGLLTSLFFVHSSKHSPETLQSFSQIENVFTNASWRAIEHMLEASDSVSVVHSLLENPISSLTFARTEVAPQEVLDASIPLLHASRLPAKEQLIQLIINKAVHYAFDNLAYQVDVEHLLIGLFTIDNPDIQSVVLLLENTHVKLSLLEEIVQWYTLVEKNQRKISELKRTSETRPRSAMNRAWTARQTLLTDKVSSDLSLSVSYGNISGLQAYENEISQALRLLQSGKLPIFVGEQGSGIEEIPLAIATQLVGDSQQALHDFRVLLLDLAPILTSENAEQVMTQILQECAGAGNVILAIDSIASLSSGESFDSISVLARYVKQGSLKLFALSNNADQRRSIENANQIRGLFTPIQLHELSADETLAEVKRRTVMLENRYGCIVTLPAIHRAVSLATTSSITLPNPARTFQLLEAAAEEIRAEGHHFITTETVNIAAEKLTGVKATIAQGEEAEKLLHLEEELKQQVIGQDRAVQTVANALKRARAGLADPNRPLASFLFAGPTGVGKTELAKSIARSYMGSEEALLRFDMSEYQSPDSVDRLIGSANDPQPKGGLLTQAIKQAPFRIILFDEIEKANPGVLDVFLQILEDARITENSGQTLRVTNTILIATTNVAGNEIYEQGEIKQDAELNRLLEKSFRPEFLNRFDAIVPFKPLGGEVLISLVRAQVEKVSKRAAEQGITLQVSQEAVNVLASLGSDPRYGARPLRRAVEQKLENILADTLLRGKTTDSRFIEVTAEMVQ